MKPRRVRPTLVPYYAADYDRRADGKIRWTVTHYTVETVPGLFTDRPYLWGTVLAEGVTETRGVAEVMAEAAVAEHRGSQIVARERVEIGETG
jgi:hypothetical protein